MITNSLWDKPFLAAEEEPFGGPADIAGLIRWWKADAIVGLSDGDPIATWPDSSDTGADLTQATPGARPLYKTNILNGMPSARFDATDDGMASSGSVSKPFTIFIVYFGNATSGFHRAIQGITNNWLIGPYNGSHQVYGGGGFLTGPAVSAGVSVYVTVTHGSDHAEVLRVDGVEEASGSDSNITGPSALAVGTSGLWSEPLDGDIFEIIVYDTVLSPQNIALVEGYLADKYGL